jgi:glycosylphosphatidylinositol transamidase
MGLLTDPNLHLKTDERPKYVIFLCRYHNYISFLLYLAGIFAFCLLGESNFNSGTYFSENALLPGKIDESWSN